MSSDEKFIVGACRVVLTIHGNDSLKGKRGVLNKIKDRIKDRFNVGVAEVGAQDFYETAVIGIVAVSNSEPYLQGVLEKVVRHIESLGEAEVAADETEFVHLGGGHMPPHAV